MNPATPHAFGCQRCVTAAHARTAAEHVAGRLLGQLVAAEDREARMRDEIHALEARLTRHAPRWEVGT